LCNAVLQYRLNSWKLPSLYEIWWMLCWFVSIIYPPVLVLKYFFELYLYLKLIIMIRKIKTIYRTKSICVCVCVYIYIYIYCTYIYLCSLHKRTDCFETWRFELLLVYDLTACYSTEWQLLYKYFLTCEIVVKMQKKFWQHFHVLMLLKLLCTASCAYCMILTHLNFCLCPITLFRLKHRTST
jgi:hypothetical protein